MKIVIFGHLQHPDYPWSVGKLKTIKTLPATDASMAKADETVKRVDERRDRKRLRAFWELRA